MFISFVVICLVFAMRRAIGGVFPTYEFLIARWALMLCVSSPSDGCSLIGRSHLFLDLMFDSANSFLEK